MADKKLTLEEFRDIKIWNWQKRMNLSEARKLYKENIKTMEAVMKWRENPGRPLSVLLIHGSNRNITRCSAELSNSQLLLDRGFELAKAEFKTMPVDDNKLILNEMFIEFCNNCVSTTSALCGFTCTCHPEDDLSRGGYQMVMWADVLLMSTPVNQSMPSSRLVQFIDRLISLDGGYQVDQLEYKSPEYRDKMIKLSHDHPVYDQRLFGRVAGYIITSKDLNNDIEDGVTTVKLSYEDLVVGALKSSMEDYGIFHANPAHYVAAGNHKVDYSHDKAEYTKEDHAEKAKKVCLAAMELAAEFRAEPPVFHGGGRIGRT